MKIVSDGLFFYTKTSDKIAHEIINYFNNAQGIKITNIASRAITRNGFVKFPLACYPNWIKILQNFCLEKNIELIWTNEIDSMGNGLPKLIELFINDDVRSDSTGVLDLDIFLNLR